MDGGRWLCISGVLCNVKLCIGQLCSSSIISYDITIIAHNQYTDISPLSNINNKNKHTNIQTTNNQHEHEHEHTDWFDPRINIRVNDVVMSVNSYDVRGSRTKTMLAAFSFKQPKDPGTCVC